MCGSSRLMITICGLVLILSAAKGGLAQGGGECGTLVPPGNVSGTWTLAGSPYCVMGDISAAGLIIEPGVHVLVDGPYEIEVRTVIHADGTAADPIVFTAKDPRVRWSGLRFHRTPAAPSLTHCRIELAEQSGIRILDSYPVLRNVVITNCISPTRGAGINIEIQVGDREILLQDCEISDCVAKSSGGGLFFLSPSARLKMDGCRIVDNQSNPTLVFEDPHRMHFDTFGGGLLLQGDTKILNSLVQGNKCVARQSVGIAFARGGGIFSTQADVQLKNTLVLGNEAHATFDLPDVGSDISFGAGIFLVDGSLSMANSVVAGNENTFFGGLNHLTGGSGIYVDSGEVSIVNSTITRNNDEGIVRNGGSVSVMNSIVYGNEDAALVGSVNASYSCIENASSPFPGDGNIIGDPLFAGTGLSCGDLAVTGSSPTIDAGNPLGSHRDLCFPPSQGGIRNDMGAFGGPGACAFRASCNGPGSPPVLVLSFSMPESEVSMGQNLIVHPTLTNGPDARNVDVHFWVRKPDGTSTVYRRRRNFPIPANHQFTREDLVGTAGAGDLADIGTYTFGVRLSDAITGGTLALQVETFRVVRMVP